ncbi:MULTISPECIES: hypothetical protein [unclassified Legionella]|uniref:hypothetical protein n=1 Tax=unclassified Legionella TaxID=2622702 RepID=UPI001F5F8A51|nr:MULTISPECIES: hypothetical protein [unclassified Legionella]MDI9819880.1 hypothetical protein [Legionella sp. PL877]
MIMNWQIPAKTFLLGEYAAIAGASAIIVTTSPCFEISLTADGILHNIHPDSPAGQWWRHHRLFSQGLYWQDPYQGKGGLGASSAQFIGAYLASCHLLNLVPTSESLLDAYYQSAWRKEGLRPSGYDILGQTQNRCVYISRQNALMQAYDWTFKEIAFLLLHSGQKLATHSHLQTISLPGSINQLSAIVDCAKEAFEHKNSEGLVDAVNRYQRQLENLQLVAPHSLDHIHSFRIQPDVLAVKGCGALGADVLLLIVPGTSLKAKAERFMAEGWTVLATSDDLYTGSELMQNKLQKTLEILS